MAGWSVQNSGGGQHNAYLFRCSQVGIAAEPGAAENLASCVRGEKDG